MQEDVQPNQLYLDGQPIGEIVEMSFSDLEVEYPVIKEVIYPMPDFNIGCTFKAEIINGYGFYCFYKIKLPRKRKKRFVGTRSSRRRNRNGINRR